MFFSLQAYIDRPRVDAEMQCEYLMETVYIQTENITDSVATQTICAEMTTGTQTQQQCEAKQCQTEVIKWRERETVLCAINWVM